MKSPYTVPLQLLVHHKPSTTSPKFLRWAPKNRVPAPINPAAARRGSRTTGTVTCRWKMHHFPNHKHSTEYDMESYLWVNYSE